MDIAQANEAFGIPGVLAVCTGDGGLPVVMIDNALARASICAHGGQVLSYTPAGEAEDLLFVSQRAHFQAGRAIKGGIPVCWPWFGPDPAQQGRPAHGFVRTRGWRLLASEACADGATRVVMGVRDDEATRALWPQPFALEIEVTVGERLELVLVTRNTGEGPMTVTQALHAYLRVGDVRRAQVLGLAGHEYIDKLADGARATQSGPIDFDGPIDRIYLDTRDELIVDDLALGRAIHIERAGSHSAVVWNPWVEQSRTMADLGDDEYQGMLCVETANAGPDRVELPPGGSHRLASSYCIRRD
jgi:glucose-6-phosphate 1-epimerase